MRSSDYSRAIITSSNQNKLQSVSKNLPTFQPIMVSFSHLWPRSHLIYENQWIKGGHTPKGNLRWKSCNNTVFQLPYFHRWWKWKRSCSVLSNSLQPMGCSPPGSSVRGILQARILKWVAIPFSRASSQPRDGTQIFTFWATNPKCILIKWLFHKRKYWNWRCTPLEWIHGWMDD